MGKNSHGSWPDGYTNFKLLAVAEPSSSPTDFIVGFWLGNQLYVLIGPDVTEGAAVYSRAKELLAWVWGHGCTVTPTPALCWLWAGINC